MLSRRSFLAGALVAGLGARARVTRERRRVVVVGSGFGGGVSALRLAQAGVPVLLLERGIRWPTGPNGHTFPDVAHLDQRTSWLGSPTFLPVAPPEGPRFPACCNASPGPAWTSCARPGSAAARWCTRA